MTTTVSPPSIEFACIVLNNAQKLYGSIFLVRDIHPDDSVCALATAIHRQWPSVYASYSPGDFVLWKPTQAIVVNDTTPQDIHEWLKTSIDELEDTGFLNKLSREHTVSYYFGTLPKGSRHLVLVYVPPYIVPSSSLPGNKGEPPFKRRRQVRDDPDGRLLSPWKDHWASLWGKGIDEFTTRLESWPTAHGDMTIMPTHPAFPMGFKHLMVREEWKIAWDHALEAEADGVSNFIITGHPGIGKTLSLYYFLSMRIAQGLPTFFQISTQYILLFHRKGVSAVHATLWPSISEVDCAGEPVWALVDINQNLTEPAKVLWDMAAPIFIVQTAPPWKKHWHWTKDHKETRLFYTRPFTLQELLQGNMVQEHLVDEQRIEDFYITYGPSAHDCYLACRSDAHRLVHEHHVTAAIETTSIDPDTLRRFIVTKDLLEGKIANPHSIVLVEPEPDMRFLAKANVATRTIMRRLLEAFNHYRSFRRNTRELYGLFSCDTGSSVTAGWFLEGLVHELLEKGINEPLLRFEEHVNNQGNVKHDSWILAPTSAISEERWTSTRLKYVPFRLREINQLDLKANSYYVPIDARPNYPSYNPISFTLECISFNTYTGPVLDLRGNILTKENYPSTTIGLFTLFQATLAREHDMHMEEDTLNTLLGIAKRKGLEAIAVRYIAIVSRGVKVAILAPISWRGKMRKFGLCPR